MSNHRRRPRRTPAQRRTAKTPGTAPGVLSAPEAASPTQAHIWRCSHDDARELTLDALLAEAELPAGTVTWVNLEGLADVALIERLGEHFGLHRLALEDALSPHQRAKTEPYPDLLFIVVHMPQQGGACFGTEQLCVFVGHGFVVTIQEGRPGDCFALVRDRMRNSPRFRNHSADYIAYALLDAVVDAYFPVLERVGETLDELEEALLTRPAPQLLARVHDVKRELLALRRAVWPMRDALGALLRDDTGLFTADTRLYLRDSYDHASRVIDFVETYRELGADLSDLYVSSMSQRLNEVMRVLTVIATIFMPLTFISSIYGMNFDPDASALNMPELRWHYGYPAALLLMLVMAIGMVVWFWRRGWLGPTGHDHAHRRP